MPLFEFEQVTASPQNKVWGIQKWKICYQLRKKKDKIQEPWCKLMILKEHFTLIYLFLINDIKVTMSW